MKNQHARESLKIYLSLSNPGYAVLIDAPWGAGKTEFIKRNTKHETEDNVLYISLYGVDSLDAFNAALMQAVWPSLGSGWASMTKAITELATKATMGVTLDSRILAPVVRQKLPETLIFDDFERCNLPHDVSSGLINQFVEHEGKRVILIANSDKVEDKEKFDTRREKLIGRVIKISADVEAALDVFLESLNEGRGKSYLIDQKSLIQSTFTNTKYENLRVLRQSLQDCALLLDAVEEQFFEFPDEMQVLVGTFLALHMAYAVGEVSDTNLMERRNWQLFTKSEDENPSPLNELQKRHEKLDIQGYHQSVLPVQLAHDLIVKGFASKHEINNVLGELSHFRAKEGMPDWIRLWRFLDQSSKDLDAIVNRINLALKNNEITNPGEFIQVYGAMDWLRFNGGLDLTEHRLARQTLQHIRSLRDSGKLVSRRVKGRAHAYYFSQEVGTISYGGQAFEPSRIQKRVVAALRREMDKLYDREVETHASHLIEALDASVDEFLKLFEFGTEDNYCETAILHKCDAEAFASRFYSLFQDDRDTAIGLAEQLAKRRSHHRVELKEEWVWLDSVEQLLQKKADAASALTSAQVRLFINWHLRAK